MIALLLISIVLAVVIMLWCEDSYNIEDCDSTSGPTKEELEDIVRMHAPQIIDNEWERTTSNKNLTENK